MNVLTIVFLLQGVLFFIKGFQSDSPSTPFPEIEKRVKKIAVEQHLPSLDLAIHTSKNQWSLGYNNPRVLHQQIYGIGSTTKLLAAVYIFSLIENHQLRLDDKISDFLDHGLISRIKGSEEITIGQLLNHTSGLSDYTKNPKWIQDVVSHHAPQTFTEKLALVDDHLENSKSFHYSNTNYLFLQKIIEKITGQNYKNAFNLFYADHGLVAIQLERPNQKLQAFFARDKKASSDVSSWNEHYGYDGGVFATPNALLDFLQKLFIEKSILNDSTLMTMQQWIPMKPTEINMGDGRISEYGYGIMKLSYHGKIYIGHAGSTLKYQSFAFYDAANKTSIILLTNGSGKFYNRVFYKNLIPAILDGL